MSIIETLRTPRIIGFVIFDYVATIIGSAGIAYYYNINFALTLIIILILSIIMHVVFNISTKTNRLLGFN